MKNLIWTAALTLAFVANASASQISCIVTKNGKSSAPISGSDEGLDCAEASTLTRTVYDLNFEAVCEAGEMASVSIGFKSTPNSSAQAKGGFVNLNQAGQPSIALQCSVRP
jgi:hypothetical protein